MEKNDPDYCTHLAGICTDVYCAINGCYEVEKLNEESGEEDDEPETSELPDHAGRFPAI